MAGRVATLAQARAAVAEQRVGGRRVVLTNGVFDVLHVGHLRSLQEARSLGDYLVVGVNTDAAVRLLKPGRPIVPEEERAELVAALEPVDLVVLFAEPTANQLLESLRPDVYAKGGDYTPANLPEAATAQSVGARLAILPLVPGRSTSELLARLRT